MVHLKYMLRTCKRCLASGVDKKYEKNVGKNNGTGSLRKATVYYDLQLLKGLEQ